MRSRFIHIFALLAFLALFLIPTQRLETAIEHSSAFKLTGDGSIYLIDTHTQEKLSIIYRDSMGRYDDEVLEAIHHTLRCHGRSEEYPISLKLIELIDHLQDHFNAKEVHVISGYRSPDYNAHLRQSSSRVAHNSLHMRGLAMDIRMPGVDKHALGAFAQSLKTGGVGVYPKSNFVHIDVGPVRNW